MSNWFKKDLKIKIAAVLIAILFWVYVSNVSNPFQTITINNVPIRVENEEYLEENGYKLKNAYRSSIEVTIRGRKEAVENVRTGDFDTVLDFSQVTSANTKKLMLSEPVCSQKGVTIVSYSPSSIDLQLERNKSGTFAVELQSNVDMKPGYVLLGALISPETVTISREESIIDSIGMIKATVEIKGLDRNMEREAQCKVFDKTGKEITSLSKDIKVIVKLEVAKEVPVSLVTRGRLAADCVETIRVIDPVKVLLKGPYKTLEDISEIKTEQVDIEGLDKSFTGTVNLVVPEGTELAGMSREIAVSIGVEKLVQKNIELAKNDISVLNAVNDGSLTYDINAEKVMIALKGKQADLDLVGIETIKPAVDVARLGEGIHKLPLNLEIPAQVKLLQKVTVEIVISKTPEPTETEETETSEEP